MDESSEKLGESLSKPATIYAIMLLLFSITVVLTRMAAVPRFELQGHGFKLVGAIEQKIDGKTYFVPIYSEVTK